VHRAKSSPLRDVAGMLRSFDYAAAAAIAALMAQQPDEAAANHRHAFGWRDRTAAAFLGAYWETIDGAPTIPEDRAFAEALLDLFLMQKALYEIGYELANRPAWLRIPVQGTLDVLDKPRSAKDA
jgi:maltose alpha-D-glucosyltransferase/alpha-amylase